MKNQQWIKNAKALLAEFTEWGHHGWLKAWRPESQAEVDAMMAKAKDLGVEETKVIFRKWPKREGGEVFALFPEEASTVGKPWLCTCYQHVGQHGAADLGIMANCKPATPEEYAPLKRELEIQIGYKLKVITRVPRNAYDKRKAQLAR